MFFVLVNHGCFTVIVPVILTVPVSFGFVTASMNRFCASVSDHPIFKTRIWIASYIGVQWMVCRLLPLPILANLEDVRKNRKPDTCINQSTLDPYP